MEPEVNSVLRNNALNRELLPDLEKKNNGK